MRSYLILFVAGLLLTLILTPLVRRLALRLGVVDVPDNHRRIHLQPTPRLGGAAIYLAFMIIILCAPMLGTLVGQELRNEWRTVGALLIPAGLIFLLGVYDDFRDAGPIFKFSIQLLAVALLYSFGYSVNRLSNPFGGPIDIPLWMSFPLTAVWVIGITNAFNLIDGLDGLASGASIFALFSLFICSLSQGHPEVSLMSIVLVGAVMGFLRYNFNPATIFLGDSGSLFLGFMAAALSLAGAQKGSTIVAVAIPLVSFGLPIADVSIAIARRFISGEALFKGDRRHIHHMLLRRGFSQRQAAIALYGVCAVFSLFGVLLLNPHRSLGALIFVIIGVGVVIGVQHLGYYEFNVLRNHIRQKISIQRQVLAANVRIERSRSEMLQARNGDGLLAALSELCLSKDFDAVALELVEPKLIALLDGHLIEHRFDFVEEARATWNWKREPPSNEEDLSDNRYWSLRLPLTKREGQSLGSVTFFRDLERADPFADFSQICGALRLDLGAALELLDHKEPPVFHPPASSGPTATAGLIGKPGITGFRRTVFESEK
jgi:UDP-GlcNAc:undecaprenyl-phosphate GlcNAc-1-phosphate transferase